MNETLPWRALTLAAIAAALSLAPVPAEATAGFRADVVSRIPAFARKYGTSCQTCHVMPPRLNAYGEAFRLNGYQLPQGDADLVRDEPLAMGAPGWRDLFPNAIWPGTIPGMPPIAMRVIADYETRSHANSNFEFPHEIELLMGGTFGQGIGAYLETEWQPGSGALIQQVFVKYQDVLGFARLPRRSLNVWVGKFDQNLLPSYRNLDRVYKNHPLWGNRRISDLRVDSAGSSRTSATQFRPQDKQPGIELNGILGRRLGYGIGVVQGVEATRDVDNHKDLYYTVRAKVGGRALDGTLGAGPPGQIQPGPSGSWVDNAIQLEHFGYFGRQGNDEFRRFGVAARGSYGNLDAAAGYVWGTHDQPWSRPGTLEFRSWFGRADYILFPWLMASLRVEDLQMTPTLPTGWRITPGRQQDLRRVLPAVMMLVRANMRITLEGELYTRDASVAEDRRLHALWARLDFAF